jgi:DNA mismatch repair ATPase MutS
MLVEESSGLENQFKKFSILITYIEKLSYNNSPNVKKFLSPFTENNAPLKLKKLQKVITALLIRENPIVRLVVNIFFPYDIFFCKKLLALKYEMEKDIPVWLEKLNELECYISLSNFAYLNPDYIFPEIEFKKKNNFETRSMGHPLIKRSKKVCNDFSFTKDNEILIITGSNMSGKSTFLKTIGINLCLAHGGAPVNAAYFRTSLYELFTCIKVNDSVADGISYFYAEVKRLKELLDEFENEKHLEMFFLIDEIFKGTNNKERLTGSRSYIKKLSQLNGTGAVTTHDLELINLADEIPSITNYHFREDIIDGKMVFDYKIHNGPCPTTNALKIMELSGLPVD